jgi:hypothetical protein
VAELLGGPAGEELRRTVRDALTGSQLIVTRDLSTLREDLIGRRYPKRRLVELVAAWVDPDGSLPPTGFVEIVDSSDPAGAAQRAAPRSTPDGPAPAAGSGPTAAFLRARWPSLARQLPAAHGADAFWLAAWWAGRPEPPPWLPAGLLAEPEQRAAAAAAASGDPGALAELADLDRRAGAGTVLGDQIATALDLAGGSAAAVVATLTSERLLRHPVHLAAGELLRRLAGDWLLPERVGAPDVAGLAARHALLDPAELDALAAAVDAAGHLAGAEAALAGEPDAAGMVESVYAAHAARVPRLLSRAELAAASPRSIVGAADTATLAAAGARLLAELDAAWGRQAEAGFPGCLPVWSVGTEVVAPLLRAHGRVAVVIVDAMRADLALELAPELAAALPGRRVQQRWAVVPAPTRTAESLAAMATGRPAPAGSAGAPGAAPPFSHLGYETAVLTGADRDHRAAGLRELWAAGPPVSVAVATGVDERLHHTSAELTALLDDAAAGLRRRLLPSLAGVPAGVPLVVLADHGFRENPSWGRGPDGRYVHGGTSLEECVIPVLVLPPAG